MVRYLPNPVTVYPETVRLDIQLNEPDDSSYNSISYAKLVNLQLGKDIESSDLLGFSAEDTYDRFKDYEEESYIDNTEIYRDTLPAGKEPEFGGFYINAGKLKLKSSSVAPNLADMNKKGRKKNSAKMKTVESKTIRKKESTQPKVKKSKHDNTKITVNHKIYSNIRLDALLKTVRRQKEKGFVTNINMLDTSKHLSVADASKKAKGNCKTAPKKKFHSTKKCCTETSVPAEAVMNLTEAIIPREDFLTDASKKAKESCKTTPKKKVHSSKKCCTETSVPTEAILNLTEAIIPREDFLTNASRKAKKICKITPEKKRHSAKKLYAEASVSSKVTLNSTEVIIPKDDFLSQTSSTNSLSSTSAPDEVKFLEEIVLLDHKNKKEHTFDKNDSPAKTAVASESFQVASSKTLLFPSTYIQNDFRCSSLNSTFVSSSPILDLTKLPSTSFPAVPNKTFHSSSEVATKTDFVPFTPALKAKKPLSMPKATVPTMLTSNRKVTVGSTLAANSSLPNTVVRSISSNATITSACPSSSNATIASAGSSSSKAAIRPTKAAIRPNSSEATKAAILPSSSKATKAAILPSSKATKAVIRPSSSKVTKTAMLPSRSKVTVLKEDFHSFRHCATEHGLFQDVPQTVPKNNSFKANVSSVHSSSPNITISPVYSSSPNVIIMPAQASSSDITISPVQASSSNATIYKEGFYPSPKIDADSALIVNSPALNTKVRSNSTRATIPKKVALFQDVSQTKPTGNNTANKTDSFPANPWDNFKNSTSPQPISKYMLNVIRDNKTPSNSIPTFPSESQSDVYLDNILGSDKNSIRTYSKANKHSFQPAVKSTSTHTSSFPVSQAEQDNVKNSMHSSNKTAVNMYKFDISPILKYREPHPKF